MGTLTLVNGLKVFAPANAVDTWTDTVTHPAFIAGSVIHSRDVNTALRNASILSYSFLEILKDYTVTIEGSNTSFNVNTSTAIDASFVSNLDKFIKAYSSGALTAKDALKLTNAKSISISDGTNSGTASSIDFSSSAYTLLLPETITNLTTVGTKSDTGTTFLGKTIEVYGDAKAQTVYATSDKRLKKNIKEYKPSFSILDLPIKQFDFKDTGKHSIGCLAQDLQKICPEIVNKDKDGYLMIEENKIVYLLLDEIKKLNERIAKLEGAK